MNWMRIYAIIIGITFVNAAILAYAVPTPIFEYTITWAPNTEADMAGYILETSDTGGDPWTIVNDNIPFGTNTYKAQYTQNVKWFRLSAFDKSKNISAASGPMRGAYKTDTTKPVPPNINIVVVVPVEQVVIAPDVTNPKLIVNGKAMTLSWDAKNVETQIWMANSAQASTLITTVGPNGSNTTINGTVSGWHCFQMRHKNNSVVGNWANANPADPTDISFCTSIP